MTIAEGAHIEDSIIMQDSCIEEDTHLKYVILDNTLTPSEARSL
ncbi:MAG: hypothetical protein U5K84_03990 [Alkalibacterium sp.]|nr:hypothetical protein [Alkalibacterium sp.]